MSDWRDDEKTIANWRYKVHELKTVQPWFDALRCGAKTFEIRRNDRNFQPGDLLVLREWYPGPYSAYTASPPVLREVTYVLRDGAEFGVADGVCVLGIRPVTAETPTGDKRPNFICGECGYRWPFAVFGPPGVDQRHSWLTDSDCQGLFSLVPHFPTPCYCNSYGRSRCPEHGRSDSPAEPVSGLPSKETQT